MSAQTQEYEYIFKIILIGSSGVGKSSLIQRYTQKTFEDVYDCTIGVDFFTKTIDVNGKTVKLQIWDTAGTEKYRSITSSYYRGSHCALIVFDLTSKDSFESLPTWIENYYKNCNQEFDKNVILVGNKIDLSEKRDVTQEKINDFIKLNNLVYFETSAKTGENVDESFQYIAQKLMEEQELKEKLGVKREVKNNNLNIKNSENLITNKKKGCF